METLEPAFGNDFARMSGLALPSLKDTKETEFEVQSALFHALKSDGFDVRGEVTIRGKCGFPGERRERYQCRFDLVIFSLGKAMHIVEVKAKPITRRKTCLEDTRQARRYTAFGIPVTFVYGLADAYEFLELMRGRRDGLC